MPPHFEANNKKELPFHRLLAKLIFIHIWKNLCNQGRLITHYIKKTKCKTNRPPEDKNLAFHTFLDVLSIPILFLGNLILFVLSLISFSDSINRFFLSLLAKALPPFIEFINELRKQALQSGIPDPYGNLISFFYSLY
ncbi:hypothetical protein ACJX0J_022484, partial [Zea mays]